MNENLVLFSSESVTEGHPDKVCDRISDAVLDEVLRKDPSSRVACEVCCTTDFVLVMGEFTTSASIDVEKIARDAIKDIGYTKDEYGFNYATCEVKTLIGKQSADIALGVDKALEAKEGLVDAEFSTGAGDQGMMFGYACKETEELMPLPITLAHRLTEQLAKSRKSGEIAYLRPDGKAQVTVAYANGTPVFVDTVVVSTQHDDGVEQKTIYDDILEKVIKTVIPSSLLTKETKYLVNPTGNFVIGGPHGDSGLTGRKIIVDTYGGMCPHGGGAFSGKDPTKVDRSACYYARYVCKNIVASGLADKCQLQVAYAIGKAEPVSLCIDTFGTGKYSDKAIVKAIKSVFDFRPQAIISQLDLRKPVYTPTSSYGHFGKSGLAWEKTDRVDALLEAINK